MHLRPFLTRLYGDEAEGADAAVPRLVNDIVETLAHEHRSVSWGNRLLILDKRADFRSERGHDILELPTDQGMVIKR